MHWASWRICKVKNIKKRIKHRQNDPNFKCKKDNEIYKIIKILKERQKRTVERKLKKGEDLIYDEKRGIINIETDECILDINQIFGDNNDGEDEAKEDIEDLEEESKHDESLENSEEYNSNDEDNS